MGVRPPAADKASCVEDVADDAVLGSVADDNIGHLLLVGASGVENLALFRPINDGEANPTRKDTDGIVEVLNPFTPHKQRPRMMRKAADQSTLKQMALFITVRMPVGRDLAALLLVRSAAKSMSSSRQYL